MGIRLTPRTELTEEELRIIEKGKNRAPMEQARWIPGAGQMKYDPDINPDEGVPGHLMFRPMSQDQTFSPTQMKASHRPPNSPEFQAFWNECMKVLECEEKVLRERHPDWTEAQIQEALNRMSFN